MNIYSEIQDNNILCKGSLIHNSESCDQPNNEIKINQDLEYIKDSSIYDIRDRIIVKKNNTKNNTKKSMILVKMNDNHKIIFGDKKSLERIERIHELYYNNDVYDIEINCMGIYDFNLNNFNLLNENSFLKNNNGDIETFIDNCVKLNDIYNYFFKDVCYTINDDKCITSIIPIDTTNDTIKYQGNAEINSFSDCQQSNKKFSYIGENTNFQIYYNTQFKNATIIDANYSNQYDMDFFSEILPEFKLCRSIIIIMDKYDDFKYKLENKVFDNIMLLNEYIDEYIVNNKPSTEDIKKYINDKYNITNDPINKIKFTKLYDDLVIDLSINNSYKTHIKHKLPYVLTEMKLNKKRQKEGMFWYGLTLKNSLTEIKTNDIKIDIENLMKIRDEQDKKNLIYTTKLNIEYI